MILRKQHYSQCANLAHLLLSTSLAAIGLFLPSAAAAQSAQRSGQNIENVVVTGLFTAPDLTKLPEPVLDTPITIDTITSQQMSDRGDISLNDVFRNVPSITLEAGEMSWQGNAPYLRGFSARTDMFLDGMRDIGDYNRDPWDLENVQVLEGPDSFLFGRGSAGGMIEQDTRKPRLDAFTNAKVSGGTNDLGRATADINVPFDDLGTPAAFRLDLMGNSNGQAGRDVVKSKRYGFAPSLAMGLGLPTRVDVSYFHQTENDIPDYGLPWYFGAPPPVNTNNYYGYRSDHLNSTADIATVRGEHDFSDGVTLTDQLRYGNYSRSITGSKPALPASVTSTTPLSSITVNINSVSVNSTEQQLMNQTDVSAHFDTGPIHHDLVAGLEYDWESSTPQVFNSSGLTNSLLNPNENLVFNPTATYPRVSVDTTTNTESVYASDTMKLGEQWQFALGARFDRFSAHFNEQVFSVPPATTGVLTGTNTEKHVDEMPSWHGSLIYKPSENGTIFLTYATSYDPSAETLDVIQSFTTFSIANENLDPEKNRSMELGTKWSLMNDQLSLSGSLFQTRKYNARIPDPSIPGFNMLAGIERVQGFELQAQGQITQEWNVSLGYDYLDSDTTKTVAGGPPLGFPLPFVARSNLTFWSGYRITSDFQVGAGGQYVGKRYAQTTAPIESAPGYVVFDAMAKYTLSTKFDLQVNVYNIADTTYFDMLHPAFVIPGSGRSAMLTLSYHS